jgi:hypothetical protein
MPAEPPAHPVSAILRRAGRQVEAAREVQATHD